MGYPINHSTVIDLLVRSKNPEHEFNNWEVQALQILNKRIKQYSLFAVILHDPAKHKSFHKAITERFHEFRVPNPTNLLFFTLEDPPSSFKEYYQKESRENSCPDLYKMLSGPPKEIFLQDSDSYSTHLDLLFFSAGIQFADKPVVIVAENLFATEYYWFETNEDILQMQLLGLSEISGILFKEPGYKETDIKNLLVVRGFGSQYIYKSNSVIPLVSELDILLKLPGDENEKVSRVFIEKYNKHLTRLRSRAEEVNTNLMDLGPFAERENLELGKITDVLTYLLGYQTEYVGQEFIIHRFMQLDALTKVVKAPKKTIADTFNKIFIRILDKISKKIDFYLEEKNETIRKNLNFYSRLEAVLEPDSFKYLKNGFQLYRDMISGRYGDEKETDISLVAVEFGKTIENEINLSIMHYLRLKLGIEQPEYFNRFKQDDCDNFYFYGPRGFSLNLNQKKQTHVVKNFDWLGPTLGRGSIAARIVAKEPRLEEIHKLFPNGNFEKLVKLIQVLPSVRNAGGHPSSAITNVDIEKMFKMIWELLELGIFHDMRRLRVKLSAET